MFSAFVLIGIHAPAGGGETDISQVYNVSSAETILNSGPVHSS